MTYRIYQGLEDLAAMLTYCRPAGCKTERQFIREWIEPLGVERDARGNLIKRIGESAVLWSSHTDTVHWGGGTQKLKVTEDAFLALDDKAFSGCLGADCTTGVWLMREMIRAEKPGLYIFHRAEECGGIGSRHIADKTPELLKDIRFAIAFDRKGTRDVITHQGSRCCSDAFADSLAAELNQHGLEYRADSSGLFTDTANYTHLVPECTNLSVGYYGAHSSKEEQDLLHLSKMLPAVLALDESKLVEKRNVDDYDDYSWGKYMPITSKGKALVTPSKVSAWSWDDDSFESNVKLKDSGPAFDMETLVRAYPKQAADMLGDYGVDPSELAEYIYQETGFVRFK